MFEELYMFLSVYFSEKFKMLKIS